LATLGTFLSHIVGTITIVGMEPTGILKAVAAKL